jgi:redox-sensitive bicupin YhaK (pirin superfamily)
MGEPYTAPWPCASDPLLAQLLTARPRDLGDGFTVRRSLPDAKRRMVGPFIFFDQMGPATTGPGRALDVRPHPHINLATVTYLFEGEILHRDSLGTVQPIRPGDVNWMTAGKGIVHSERTPAGLRERPSRLFGIQTWVALPVEHEETAPDFLHVGESDLPLLQERDSRIRLIVGTLYGARSPVPTLSDTFYADAVMDAGARITLMPEHEERGAYIVDGTVESEGRDCGPGEMLVFQPGDDVFVSARTPARVILLGGEPLGPRHIWWNFVSSRKERIQQAAEDWKAGRFDRVPGETEFIPLPEAGPGPVYYP